MNKKAQYCRFCGKKIEQGSIFCKHCGMKQNSKETSSKSFLARVSGAIRTNNLVDEKKIDISKKQFSKAGDTLFAMGWFYIIVTIIIFFFFIINANQADDKSIGMFFTILFLYPAVGIINIINGRILKKLDLNYSLIENRIIILIALNIGVVIISIVITLFSLLITILILILIYQLLKIKKITTQATTIING